MVTMIQKFVDKFMAAKPAVLAGLREKAPRNYDDLVVRLLTLLSDPDSPGCWPDPERLNVIDHGDYQGTRLYIVGESGYQPSTYWSIFVNYGSCSVCDAFEALYWSDGDEPTEEQLTGCWTLMLHMVQRMRELVPGEPA